MRMEENRKKKSTKGVGRKPKSDPAVHRYVVRLNSEENGRFNIQFQKSGLKEHSKFIKAMLFGHEIKVVKIDKATMDYYIRLTNFYHTSSRVSATITTRRSRRSRPISGKNGHMPCSEI